MITKDADCSSPLIPLSARIHPRTISRARHSPDAQNKAIAERRTVARRRASVNPARPDFLGIEKIVRVAGDDATRDGVGRSST
jgi:hypothetical protein